MKTRLSFLAICLSVCVVMSAAPIDSNRALQIAQDFVPTSSKIKKNSLGAMPTGEIVYTHYMPKSHRPAIYVVNIGHAFALVSADDVAHPILGYNYSQSWPKDGNLPPQVKSFLDDLAAQMEAAANQPQDTLTAAEWDNPRQMPRRVRKDNLPDSVGPLLTTTWDQGQYYNAMCPVDGQSAYNGRVPAGCVAVAMAQIVNYWGQRGTISTRGTHSYVSDYGKLLVDYGNTTYDFAHMPNQLTANSTQQEKDAVAKLMYECGVAVNMEYGTTSSSAYTQDARAALVNFWGFNPELSYAERAKYTKEEWESILRNDIASGQPVYYSGKPVEGEGHSFICDGYRQDGYFHFNYGWMGACDGWYVTTAVMSYISRQSALLHISPYNNGRIVLGQMSGMSTFVVDEPLEFCDIMGYNKNEIPFYANQIGSTVAFVSSDNSSQMVVDVMEYEGQTLSMYDGLNSYTPIKTISAGSTNLSPVISTGSVVKIEYNGYLNSCGFKVRVAHNSSCRLVSDISTHVDSTSVSLTWTDHSEATHWQIAYGPKGAEPEQVAVCETDSNTLSVMNLLPFTEYDFIIRPRCSDNQYGEGKKVTVMVEAPYWQDIVTSPPDGYYYDNPTNTFRITTAEGLAWWAKNQCSEEVYLMADIDLSGYKWRPSYMKHTLHGNGHVISNLYINEPGTDVAMFSDGFTTASIEDVGLDGAYVKGRPGSRVGTLFGTLRGTIRNSYVRNSIVTGDDWVGGLVGATAYGSVENSYVSAKVTGLRWIGLVSGEAMEGRYVNCYALGELNMRGQCYNGGIVGYIGAGEINHCYSVETQGGIAGYKGTTIISDTSTIVMEDSQATLLTPISYEEELEDDLLSVLNYYVELYGDSTWCVWTADTNFINQGFPLLGEKQIVRNPEVSNVTIQNIDMDGDIAVVVNWEDSSDVTQWQIRYRDVMTPDEGYIYHISTHHPDTIYDIYTGSVFEFSVRAVYANGQKGKWSAPVEQMVDLLYWADVVTAQPEGYQEDANGNVYISSAEGLTWLSVRVNGLHGQPVESYEGKKVVLTEDVDLDGYRWNPIGGGIFEDEWRGFSGVFDGQNHVITGLYVNQGYSDLGLFGYVYKGSVLNVRIEGGIVISAYTGPNDTHSVRSSAIGGLIGFARECKEINNCHSSATIYGVGGLGSLCGDIESLERRTIISNCSASGAVFGSGANSAANGALIGDAYGDVVVQNCYATGNVYVDDSDEDMGYRGGLIGYMMYSEVYNCYSTGNVFYSPDSQPVVGKVIGNLGTETHARYLYAPDHRNTDLGIVSGSAMDVLDTTLFVHNGSDNVLYVPVSIGDTTYENLVDALNAWVLMKNSPYLRTWIMDENGYPTYGDAFVPSCYNPTDLNVTQATVIGDTTIRTRVEWSQVGQPDYWELVYVPSLCSPEEGTKVIVRDSLCVISDIPVGIPLDFYVRAVCDDNEQSCWSEPVTYIADKLRWTEVVTSQPEGYEEDATTIRISSAEGLAWLVSVTNGLNGEEYSYDRLRGKTIYLLADVDLSAYRWTPIGTDEHFAASFFKFDGRDHTISGLYVNELMDYIGMFGKCLYSSITNLRLRQCCVRGERYVGAICANATDLRITNCAVDGEVVGIEESGGLSGRHMGATISNCYFIGDVTIRRDLKKVNTQVGFVGGISGMPSLDSICNCYFVGKVSENCVHPGVMTGSCVGGSSVINCYYRDYITNLPITAIGNPARDNSCFVESGEAWILKNPPYVNGAFRTDLVDALNAWVDENDTDGNYLHWVADTTNVNGGYPIFMVETPSPGTDINTPITDNPPLTTSKILHDGQILILRGDRLYTITGQSVR